MGFKVVVFEVVNMIVTDNGKVLKMGWIALLLLQVSVLKETWLIFWFSI